MPSCNAPTSERTTATHWPLGAPPPIPRAEIDLLVQTSADAWDLASAGAADAGHAYLQAGLRRAEQGRQGDAPWATALVELWRQDLATFGKRFTAG